VTNAFREIGIVFSVLAAESSLYGNRSLTDHFEPEGKQVEIASQDFDSDLRGAEPPRSHRPG
jgi:hypothetical protein